MTTNIEKKLKGMDLQNSSNTLPFTEGLKDAITNMPQRESGMNELSTVGSILKNNPVFSLTILFFLADANVAVEAHIIFNPSSIEVAAMMPRDVTNTFFGVVQCLSENLNHVHRVFAGIIIGCHHNDDYLRNTLKSTVKMVGEKKYQIKSGGYFDTLRDGNYTQLIVTENGNETVIYAIPENVLQGRQIIAWLFVILFPILGTLIIYKTIIKPNKPNKNKETQ